MPSKSPAQKRTMQAAAHNKDFAEKVGILQSVAREFEEADEKKARKAEDISQMQTLTLEQLFGKK
jgi:hypothetical protein